MSGTKGEIANKIREGAQRRGEEIQRIRQLRRERREELKERASNASSAGSSSFIPYIIISLVFLSFPLSEPKVDWLLVCLFLALNGTWTIFFRSTSWINWAIMCVSNIVLVRWSPFIPDLPRIISQLSPTHVAVYGSGNLFLCIILYFGYVERRAPWNASSRKRGKKSTRSDKGDGEQVESLEEFARRRDWMNRLDLAASGMILGNVALLIVLGVVPLDLFMQSLRQFFSFVR
ncbi:hypothetical protein TcBrA4_0087490 [Trypanosoma cruzi]|nr:hypothetical protein TcBrA4_0087490 [Trypanosoma cruzi]